MTDRETMKPERWFCVAPIVDGTVRIIEFHRSNKSAAFHILVNATADVVPVFVVEAEQLRELVEDALTWREAFKHTHQNDGTGGDGCAKCGLDLRDGIHVGVDDRTPVSLAPFLDLAEKTND